MAWARTIRVRAARLPGSELVVFEESSHLAHLEEPDRYQQVLRDFLRRAEARSA